MTDTIVLLHGGATGSSSWNPVACAFVSSGASVFAPDMLGYGASPPPTGSYGIPEEVAHLTRLLGLQPHSCNGIIYAVGFGGTFHLVTHSLGSLIGLHLRRALGARVRRMTLVDPVVVSVLREGGENDAYAEMEEQYQRFMSLSADHEAAAHFFVDHWSGARGIRWESGTRDGHVARPDVAVGDERDAVRHGDARVVGRVTAADDHPRRRANPPRAARRGPSPRGRAPGRRSSWFPGRRT